ncbi:MAG: L-ribulose-5-phosphate 4-epimerase AraD [Lachnospiraceae bacterium]|nr:L-ribulose-5-phosphate 4-epimerase AraD [Lachnospiraceae bacterium]
MQEIKQEVYEANLELVRRNLVIYTWGNVSVIDRERGLVIIKPRGIEYDELTADDMSVTDLDGNMVEGKLLPSVDLDIHLAIYRKFDEVGAIAHTHSTYATAFAQGRRDIPVYGTTHGDHFYGAIPCARQLTEEETATDYEKHTGDVIVETFLERGLDPMQVFGVLAAGHGPFTWGADSATAVENSVILEELARMAILTEQVNPAAPSLEPYILDKHFLRKHGKNSYFYQSK